jgi:hypothetical protein
MSYSNFFKKPSLLGNGDGWVKSGEDENSDGMTEEKVQKIFSNWLAKNVNKILDDVVD